FGLILPEYLPVRFQKKKEREKNELSPLEEAERDQVIHCLKSVIWNQTRAAQALGIDRKTLRSKIQRYGLFKGSESEFAP
ncbi:MAG: helix-turn-helix domain-containing protein, partial [Syntrophus sp. (in: bacteria)]